MQAMGLVPLDPTTHELQERIVRRLLADTFIGEDLVLFFSAERAMRDMYRIIDRDEVSISIGLVKRN